MLYSDKEKTTLSIYVGHDAGATFIDKNNKLRIIEYERFVRKRYAMFTSKRDSWWLGSNDKERGEFLKYVKSNLANQNIKNIIYSNGLTDKDKNQLLNAFPNAKFEIVGHHMSHAACAYFQSNFDNAIIFSIDGGGLDNNNVSMTNIYYADNQNIRLINKPNIDLGNPYGMIGHPISEIKPGKDGQDGKYSLVYAGKVMGLCAYGRHREHWIDPMRRFYSHKKLKLLSAELGLPLGFNSLTGEDSYDLAATSQYVFEEILFNLIKPFIDSTDRNVVLTGGCALNVLFNQKLAEYLFTQNKKLYVPPNPNDSGIALGQFLLKHKHKPGQLTYSGLELLDRDKLLFYVKKYNAKKINTNEIISLLKEGKIVGLVSGDSEVGPRALGNRSIICYPSFPNMKDTLNAKVKFREWFRPFAPVCRFEDRDVYFDNAFESICMSFAPTVKKQYREELNAITHVDGTARLQTVTKEQHSGFYNILSALKDDNSIPVILNTSFNIKGYPILSRIEDAIYVLENTELDCVIINNFLFRKNDK